MSKNIFSKNRVLAQALYHSNECRHSCTLISAGEDKRGQGLPWTSGQGTIEYLVIIGVVVVLALVVVGILVSQTDSANNVSDSADKINSLVGSNGLAITEAAESLDGEVVLVFVNNSGELFTLENITSVNSLGEEGVANTFSESIVSGDKKSIVLANVDPNCSCGEAEKINCTYKIEYVSAYGLEKSQLITTNVDCLGSASISNPNDQVVSFDTNAPVVTLVTPADENETASPSISFSYSVSDDRNVASCSLLINGSVNQTDSISPFNSFTATAPIDGDNNWSVRCTDASNNSTTATTRTLTYNSPYSIGTCLELQNMENDVNGSYELTGDIDCSDTINWNSGLGFEPVGVLSYCTDEGCGDETSCEAQAGGCQSTWYSTAGCDTEYGNICDWDSTPCEDYCGGTYDWDNYVCVNPTSEATCNTDAILCSYCGSWYDANTCAEPSCTTQETCERAYGCASIWNATAFTGNLEGNGYTISNLYINRTYRTGLFGYVDGGTISNLNFSDSNINGGDQTGTLVAYLFTGTVSDVNISGRVNGTGGYAAGIIGITNSGSALLNSSFTGTVSSTGYYPAGIVSRSQGGDINNCSFIGTVTSTDASAGGFIGYNQGFISEGNSSVTITSTGSGVGGFAGYNSGTIELSSANGRVVGRDAVGGFVGSNAGTIRYSDFNGDVNGTGSTSNTDIGGFAGRNSSILIRNYAKGTAYTYGSSQWQTAGGFVGYNTGSSIRESYAEMSVTNTAATGTYKYIYAAGFVAWNNTSGDINKCYSLGSVKSSSTLTGGFVGQNWNGKINDSYSLASIAVGSANGSGFVGTQTSGAGKAIINTFSAGRVNVGSYGFANSTGGGTISQSYFDTNTSTKTSGPTAIAKTTTQMYQQATFVNWDFVNTWVAREDTNYPILKWQTE